MKLYHLIDELKKYPMNSDVRLNDKDGDPVLFVIATDENIVYLEGKEDTDIYYQIECLFSKSQDINDLYEELYSHSILPEEVYLAMGYVASIEYRKWLKESNKIS